MASILLFGTSIFMTRYLQLIKSDNYKDDYQINSNTLGITFGPTGYLFMYSHGIAAYLEDHFDLSNVIFAGNSGGCQPAFFLASEIGMTRALNEWYLPMINDIIDDNLSHPFLITTFDRSEKYLKKLYYPEILNKLKNKYFVVVTHLPYFRPIYLTKFYDFNDIFLACKASQYIPFVFGYPCIFHRSKLVCDGWLSCDPFKPVEGIKWLELSPFKWNRFQTSEGLTYIKNFYNIQENLNLREIGYQDAKERHQLFLDFGLKEKNF